MKRASRLSRFGATLFVLAVALVILSPRPIRAQETFYLSAAAYSTVEGGTITGTVYRKYPYAYWSQAVTVRLDLSQSGLHPISSTDVPSNWQDGWETFTIAAYSDHTTFTLPFNDDDATDYNRTATLAIGNGYVDTSVIQSATVTLIDNDTVLGVAIYQNSTLHSGAEILEGGIQGANATTLRFYRNWNVYDMTVYYNLSGTASSNYYTPALTGVATIPNGGYSTDIALTAVADSLNEGTESLNIRITNGLYRINQYASNVTVSILDDFPSISIYSNTAYLLEGLGTGSFTIGRDTYYPDICGAKTVNYRVGGTASNGVDYTPSLSGSATIPAGQGSVTVTITPQADSLLEGTETIVLTLTNGAYTINSTNPSAAIGLLDDYPTISIVSNNAYMLEGLGSGSFTISRNGYTNLAKTVNYRVGGTASNGVDYTPFLSGTATIPAGSSSVAITIYPQADTLPEATESVVLTLTNGAYAINSNSQTAAIGLLDDYPTLSIFSNNVNVLEGLGSASFTIYRNGYTNFAKTANYRVGGTASNGVDYTPFLSGVATIPAGAASVTITVYPQADALQEGTETMVLTLTNGVYTIDSTNNTASIGLLDDYPLVWVTAPTNQLTEGSGMYVTFWRDPNTCYVAEPNKTINFHVNGTATNGDFSFTSSAVIPAGQCSASLLLSVLTDNLVEGVEKLTITLDQGVYTITNPASVAINLLDDYATVNIANKPDFAAESGPIASKITLRRSGNLTRSVTNHYQVTGTAVAGTNYQALPGTAIFNPGVQTIDIWVTPINDGVYEAPRTVVLTLQPDVSYVLGLTTQAVVTIIGQIPNDGRTPIIGTRYYRTEPHPALVLNSLYISWDDLSFVIPLEGEQGAPFDIVNGPLATNFVNRPWTDARYHMDWLSKLYGYSQTNINNRDAFNNPIVAFGGGHGGTPLYIGQRYSLGIYAGSAAPTYTPVRIAVYFRTNGNYAGEILLPVPNPNDAGNWTNYANAGFEKMVEAFGLKTTLRSTPNLNWGTLPGGSFIMTHESSSSAKDYYYLVEATGYSDGLPLATTAAGVAAGSRLYTLEFETRPPWRALVVDQPHFGGALSPPEYDGKSPEELQAAQANLTNQLPSSALSYTNLNQSPELRFHPLLDQLVLDLRANPIALANYVQNEVELTDPIGLNDDGSQVEQAFNLGGVNRSALGVYLEGQGSPTEQCALLVYLLRKANIPASYVFAPNQGVKLLDERLSRLLRTRIPLARDESDKVYTTNKYACVNYPWVAAYVDGRWVHLFPWLKDHEVIEGLDLRDVLPPAYPDGLSWVKDYVLGNTNLLAFGSTTDITPAYIYPRWLANALQTNTPRAVRRRCRHALAKPPSVSGALGKLPPAHLGDQHLFRA